jgi:hypothetical protein
VRLPVDDPEPLRDGNRRGRREQPQPDGLDERHPEPGDARRGEDDDQPFGALGDPDVGPHAQTLGAGARVGDQVARHQAEDA